MSCRDASADQAAEHQVHVEMQVKIKQGSITSSCGSASEDQAAEHQVHVEQQVKIKQQSIKLM